ncbi:MAG: hypothetical protein SFU56_20810 [Capsulimonadales bacterium]|nr:hypothetical protein [Capsulimonadales bacterium]
MAKREIPPIFLLVGGVLTLGVLIYFFYQASSPPTPPPGSYTPGVPPWMEKNRTQAQPGVHNAPSAGQKP